MTADSPEFAAINRTLEAHAGELLAIPGVTGVAVGLQPDGRTPCLQVLVRERTQELLDALPATLDGHAVVIRETGPIRPLGDS